jgi:lysophospholipase L1-like esterase
MSNKSFARFVAVLAVLAVAAVPVFAAPGKADFTRLVVIGTSLGSGLESGSLNVNHQQYSFPAVIARQVGLTVCGVSATAADNCFAQPLVSFPGIGNENVLVSVAPSVVISPAAGTGQPLVTTFGRPYNNLSVPGIKATESDTLTGAQPATSTATSFAQFILRGLGTQVNQALALHPTFIIVELGANDVLTALTSGTSKVLTPLPAFTTSYNALLDKLHAGAPDAGIVVSNLPTNPATLPYINLIAPYIVNPATGQPVLGPDGKVIYYFAETNGALGQLDANARIPLHAQNDLRAGYGIPPALKTIPPFNALPHAGEPLPDADALTGAEITEIVQRAVDINAAINTAASARQIPVADFAGLFNRVTAPGGIAIGPFAVTNAFVTGGFFSLDGLHFTDLGYTLFANEFIKAINSGYGTHIKYASVTPFFTNNGAISFLARTTDGDAVFASTPWELSSASATQFGSMFVETPAPSAAPGRTRRVTNH